MLERLPKFISDTSTNLENVAIIVAREIKNAYELTSEQKLELLSLIRRWVEYAKDNKVDSSDTLSVRYHLLEFSKRNFAHQSLESRKEIDLQRTSIDTLTLPDGVLLKDYINKNFEGHDIFNDQHTAVYGGSHDWL